MGGREFRDIVTIVNRLGLHARAAAKFVKTAQAFEAEIFVTRKGQEVSGHSIMGLMMLAAGPGSLLEIRTKGKQAEAALGALTDLINRKFDEDD